MRRKILGLLCAAGAFFGVLAAPSASGNANQLTYVDSTLTHVHDRMTVVPFNSPASWVAPNNYANGKAYLRLEIHSKPSNKLVNGQYCMWRAEGTNKYKYETCAPAIRFSAPGVYYIDLGTPSRWWKLNGVWDFTKAPTDVRIMMKDAATGKLLMSKFCGVYCYRAGDLLQHVPIRFTATMILVPQGGTLNPPAKFQGCPSTWSTECPRPS